MINQLPPSLSAVTDDEGPQAQCPTCASWQEDLDGFGVMRCQMCGYCAHPSINGNVCGLCGSVIPESLSPLPDDEGTSKRPDFNPNYSQCAECGGTFRHYQPCSHHVADDEGIAKEKTNDDQVTRVDTPGSPVDSRTAATHEVK